MVWVSVGAVSPEASGLTFGNDQAVSTSNGADVHEGEDRLRLKELEGGNLA